MRDHVPAFPTEEPGNPDKWGMDLRDYFAGQALNGYLASIPGDETIKPEHMPAIAEFCYRMSDAMMEARKK